MATEDLIVIIVIAIIAEGLVTAGWFTHIGTLYLAGGVLQLLNWGEMASVGAANVQYNAGGGCGPAAVLVPCVQNLSSTDFNALALSLIVLTIVSFILPFYERTR